MKKFLLVFSALLVALTAAGRVSEEILQKNLLSVSKTNEGVAIQGRSLSSSGKDALENFISKLPCGWPNAGVPPLAPYTKDQIVFELKKAFAEIFAKVEHLRIDGLDIVLINKLKINYTFSQKVKFNLVWPRLVFSGKLIAGAFVNLMNEYGISVQYDGNGDFEIALENITFEGQFKYTMPYFIFGSMKIYKFEGSLTLGSVVSQIDGIAGEGKFKELLDNQIEDILMKTVSLNQDKINGMLVDDLVPFVNRKLKGNNFWTIFASMFGKQGNICYPPADPWA